MMRLVWNGRVVARYPTNSHVYLISLSCGWAVTKVVLILFMEINAHELNKDLTRRFKRKTGDLDIKVENIKKSRTERPNFKMATMQCDHLLSEEQNWGNLIPACPPTKTIWPSALEEKEMTRLSSSTHSLPTACTAKCWIQEWGQICKEDGSAP